jgi:hypothetical protein
MRNPFRSVFNQQQQQQQQQEQNQYANDIEEQAPISLSYAPTSGLDHRRISQHAEVIKELTAAEKKNHAASSLVSSSSTSVGNSNNNTSNSNLNRSMSTTIDLDSSVRPGKGLPILTTKSPSIATPDPRLIHSYVSLT